MRHQPHRLATIVGCTAILVGCGAFFFPQFGCSARSRAKGGGGGGNAGAAGSGGSGLVDGGESDASGGVDAAGGTAATGGSNPLDGGGTGAADGSTGGSVGSGGTAGAGCGDATRTGSEECDDGNKVDTDGCRNDCTVDCGAFPGNAAASSFNGHCYWVQSAPKPFGQSQFDCAQAGGHLATFTSALEEAAAIKALGSNAVDSQSYFLGGHDDQPANSPVPGKYSWITAEAWNYTNWITDEPNAFCHLPQPFCPAGCCDHCTTLVVSSSPFWADVPCQQPLPSICEWDVPG